MTDRDELVRRIAEDVRELTEARQHTEPYFKWTKARHRKLEKHVTDHDSLLGQLQDQLPPSNDADSDDASMGGSPASRPPLAFDCLAVLLRIEAGSAHWASVRLRHDLRETAEQNLHLLVGAAPRLDDADLKDLAKTVHGWRNSAATLTGWQSPPFTPHAPCPLCGRMDALRINPDQKRGLCVECQATWEEADGSIGLLADEIRRSDPQGTRTWQEQCDHTWRLTTVGPDGIRGLCLTCHTWDCRPAWPKGTPVWTELDEFMRGCRA